MTGDALHTQRGLSAYIVDQGGDYVWPVKGNQPQLYQDIERLFALLQPIPGFGQIATDFQKVQTVNRGHGRFEVRTIQTSEMLNDYRDWPGVGQVYGLQRKFSWVRQGQIYKTSCEVEWGITSLSRQVASPERVLAIRRRHWLIETGLHSRRDVTFQEDGCAGYFSHPPALASGRTRTGVMETVQDRPGNELIASAVPRRD